MRVTSQFPRRRGDGSLSVSCRFEIPELGLLSAATNIVVEWVREKSTNGIPIDEDLREAPRVAVRSRDHLEVIFEGLPGSVRWKNWLVEVTQRLSAIPGIKFECFYDLVADAPHPASVAEW